MNWENILEEKLETLGPKPSAVQLHRLSSWIIENVPTAYWPNVAPYLPGNLYTEFSMRASENGF